MWKAILLDADGTFMDFNAAEARAIEGIIQALELTDPEAVDVYKRGNDACWAALERGELTIDALETLRFELFLRHYGLARDAKEVSEMYIELLSRQRFVLPGAQAAIEELAKRYRLAVVTNGIARVQHGRLDAQPFREALGPLIISGEVGVAKPDPEMVYRALEALRVKPEEALLVGDSLTSDVRAANAAGVAACWVNASGKPLPEGYEVEMQVSSLAELPDALRARG